MAKVMVVDNDAELLHALGRALEHSGYQTVLVTNPFAVMDKIREEAPDALVLDVMMPMMSGHEVAEEIRASRDLAHLPIIMLTARAQAVDREAALASGADDYLTKPVELDELIERVEILVARRPPPGQVSGRIVCVLGLRGGVGRTTLAVNLAAAFAGAGQIGVCLLDLSPAGAQAALHLRISPQTSWADLDAYGWEAVREQLLQHKAGLSLLSAPRQPVLRDAPAGELVTELLLLFREHAPFTVVDLPPVLNPAALTALKMADTVLHVVGPDVISVQSAFNTSAALAASAAGIRHKVYILNQITPDAQLPNEAVEKGLRARVGAKIGYDPNQSRALAQGVPLALTPANSPLPKAMRGMAGALLQQAGKAPLPAA